MKNEQVEMPDWNVLSCELAENIYYTNWNEFRREGNWESDFWEETEAKIIADCVIWFIRIFSSDVPNPAQGNEDGFMSQLEEIINDIEIVTGELIPDPIYQEPEASENFREFLEKLAQSNGTWRMDLLKKNPHFALETWEVPLYYYYIKELGDEETIELFQKSTLYLISCCAYRKGEQFSNPLRVFCYLDYYLSEQREIQKRMKRHYEGLVRLKNTKNVQSEECDETNPAKITMFLSAEEIEKQCIMLMEEYLSKEVWDTYQDDIQTSIKTLVSMARENTHCEYMFLFMTAHVFSAYYLLDPNTRSDREMEAARESPYTFMEYSRLCSKHHRKPYFKSTDARAEDLYANPMVGHPLIMFMERLTYSFFSPMLEQNKPMWNVGCKTEILFKIQANWLAFYLENYRAHFDHHKMSMETMNMPLEMLFSCFFEGDGGKLEYNMEWILDGLNTEYWDEEVEIELKKAVIKFVEGLQLGEQMTLGEILYLQLDWEKKNHAVLTPYQKPVYEKTWEWMQNMLHSANIKQKRTKNKYQSKYLEGILIIMCRECLEKFEVVFKELSDEIFIDQEKVYEEIYI